MPQDIRHHIEGSFSVLWNVWCFEKIWRAPGDKWPGVGLTWRLHSHVWHMAWDNSKAELNRDQPWGSLHGLWSFYVAWASLLDGGLGFTDSPKLQEYVSQRTRKKLHNLVSPTLEVTEHYFCTSLLNEAVIISMPRFRGRACLHPLRWRSTKESASMFYNHHKLRFSFFFFSFFSSLKVITQKIGISRNF